MNYHLNRDGQNLGVFPLAELQRRRLAGELTGRELVWTQGMAAWVPLDSVLPQNPPGIIAAPPVAQIQKSSNKIILAAVLLGLGLFAVVTVLMGVAAYKFLQGIHPALMEMGSTGAMSAMEAASKPVECGTNALTAADVMKANREFRTRQYLDGYKLRGERNPKTDALALGLVGNWIACNNGGEVDTNLPSLAELGNQLAHDPDCTDPLVLTVAAVNAAELREAIRRMERAVKGFENSQHLGYPKFFATVTLTAELIQNEDKAGRLPALDAQALEYLKAAFTDGSLRPADQAELGDILLMGWGRSFFDRNAAAVHALVQDQGKPFEWLALVLEGEHEIDAAWAARGDGYSDTVSASGWQGFNGHLARARKCLTRAWQLRRDLALAPCEMINVSLGDSGIGEMRQWFDRTVEVQIDYAKAWKEMRWGLRPRWFGSIDAMLAFGETALKTQRFDTDVPRVYYDSLSDVESEMDLPSGRHFYGRADVWPRLQEMYEGYIAGPSVSAYDRDGWRSTYAVVAYLTGKYDVAQKQLQALNWQPHGVSLTGWWVDLSAMPLEVAGRTGESSERVKAAEADRQAGDVAGAWKIYNELAQSQKTGPMTLAFAQDRLVTLGVEQKLSAGGWTDFMPAGTNFTGWHVAFGKCTVLPDGALEVSADENGHLLYSRARLGTEFEVRGQFEVVSSTTTAFQGGLVMGVPQFETDDWYAFRVIRNRDDGDVATFSQYWTPPQVLAPAVLNSSTNTFYFRFQGGRVSATVDGQEVFKEVYPPKNSYVTTNEFFLGLGAFNHSNASVIRYRNLQVRRLVSE